MTCPTCHAPGMTDFCTECGEVFETLTNRPNDDSEKMVNHPRRKG